GEGRDLAGQVDPRPGRIPHEQAAVPRHERRIVGPGGGDAETDAGERQHSGAEDGGVSASGQAGAVVAVVAWAEAQVAVGAGWAVAVSAQVAVAVSAPAAEAASAAGVAAAIRPTHRCRSSTSAAAGCTCRRRTARA